MSIITPSNKRKLVRNYQPKEPPVSRTVRFETYDYRWSNRQQQYLIHYYSDCETEKIANIMNCDVKEVAAEARRLHLCKSAKFKKWFDANILGLGEKNTGAPMGYHWESDGEMAERLLQEREEDSCRAAAIADTFDFCTKSEKQCITSVLYQALRWHRQTSPNVINK